MFCDDNYFPLWKTEYFTTEDVNDITNSVQRNFQNATTKLDGKNVINISYTKPKSSTMNKFFHQIFLKLQRKVSQ